MQTNLFINGHWKSASTGETFSVDNPATEDILADVQKGSPSDVQQAVDAAKAAFNEWRWITANERAAMLHEVVAKTHQHWDVLAECLTLEQGKPKAENEEEVELTASTFRYYAEMGRMMRGQVIPSGERSQLNMVIKEPFGVVGCILPWNYPLILLAWKMAPALAAGNTLVIKPSEMTPLTTLMFIETCCDHLPNGVVNVIPGMGDVGEAVVEHPDVPMIAFTGSVATGQKIASICAPMMKHTHLELGGKDAFVVGPDADVEKAAKAVSYAALANCGQVCTSSERVYVPQHLKDTFAENVTDLVKSLNIGPGMDDDTDIGPMIGAQYREKVIHHVKDAEQKGASVLTGGIIPDGKGYFYQPTVLMQVDHSMRIMTEETFGPVIPIMGYDNIDEAISLVNNSSYGLGATLRSNDPKICKQFFEEVKAGTVWINDPLTDNTAGPFGGMKMTGGGRELGEEGFLSFMETKHVHWDFSDEPKDWWLSHRL